MSQPAIDHDSTHPARRILRAWLLGGAIGLGCWLAPGAWADQADHERARALVESGTVLSLERLLERTQGAIQGRLLDVELEQMHGSWVYELEWLDPEGRVWESTFDAASGEPLGRKEE